jgi:hypothetical protein
MIKIVYRISDTGFNKIKPDYVNNENCLKNAIAAFPLETNDWYVLADGVSIDTEQMIKKYIPIDRIENINIKNGPGFPFVYALNKVIKELSDDTIVYFIENDYIHKPNSDVILEEGFSLGTDYVTLYTHPDKFINAKDGGNPEIDGGGEITQVFLTKSCYWMLTNSTTGTFASTVQTLKEDYQIITKYANNPYWNDYQMFVQLRAIGRSLLSPIPAYSTHGETKWLSKPIDGNIENLKAWENILKNTLNT